MIGTAKARWTQLDSERASVLNRARECAELTIPSILPPSGANQTTVLPTPFQSLGARGVNNVSSKLLLTLFQPNNAFFRLRIDDDVLAMLGGQRDKVEEVLRRIENKVMLSIETSNLRGVIHTTLKHLVVTGNALLYMPRGKPARMFRISDYVVVRTPDGEITDIIMREQTYPDMLSPELRAKHKVIVKPGERTPVDIFTVVRRLEDGRFEWWQEINDIRVAGSIGRAPIEESPFIVLHWSAISGEDYGRGMVEECIGDLRSLEGLTKSMVQFSAAAAKIIFLVHSNSTTDEDELIDAESGQFVTGRKDDIDVLQLEKFADFQVTKAVSDELTLRLSHTFLLQSGTVRNAERVTAEEIRLMAQELEDVLGGVYSVLSQELQLPLVRRLMANLKADKELPEFPKFKGKSAVQPTIITGFDALGRGHELNRWRAFYADLQGILGPEQAMTLFNPRVIAQMLATSHNVNVDGAMKTEQQLDQEQQQAQLAALAEKAAGPVSGAVAKGMMNE